MADAVVLDTSTTAFTFGRSHTSDVTMKRKTPSELRGEQLKRRADGNKAAAAGVFSTFQTSEKIACGVSNGAVKPQTSRVPRYIDTRVDEVFPVKKSSERCRNLLGKDKAKDFSLVKEVSSNFVGTHSGSLPVHDQTADSVYKEEILNKSKDSGPATEKVDANQGFHKLEKCSQSSLRNVVDLHVGNDKLSGSAKVDMEKALRGFVARDIPVISGSFSFTGKHVDLPLFPPRTSSPEFEIPGYRAPLDLTLKTSVRFISSFPVKWCHRLSACPAPVDVNMFVSQSCSKSQVGGSAIGVKVPNEVLFSKALQSWVYPQSSLPSSIISVMASSVVKGESDFLLNRQQDWEDSFQNLYYLLRKNLCNIFYVNTSQFVVLFTGGNFLERKKHTCSAYLSPSTRGLRSLLRKHGIKFEMPLCHAEMVQADEDDLVELSEIEKQNLGQAYHLDSTSEVDNSPQSVLSFIGNENVHCLYDFLLNYRSFLSSSSGYDVPVLYAPLPFQNASLHVPEVRSKEVRKAEAMIVSSSESEADENETLSASSSDHICYSIEVKDAVLPPWVVSRLCAALSSDHKSFEANFINESTSVGLNVALDNVCKNSDVSTCSNKSLPEIRNAYGIAESVSTPHLRSASLRHLKFSDGAYVASLIPI